MRVVVHVEPYELADLVHLLESSDFKVTVVPSAGDPVEATALEDAEVELVASRHRLADIDGDQILVGDLMIDIDARIVQSGGTRIDLTSREFDLLCTFVRNANRVLSKDMLVDLVWAPGPVTPNAVEARVSALRRKLGRGNDELIATVRGVGYVLRTTTIPIEARRTLLLRQRDALVRQRDEHVARRAEVRRRPVRRPDARP